MSTGAMKANSTAATPRRSPNKRPMNGMPRMVSTARWGRPPPGGEQGVAAADGGADSVEERREDGPLIKCPDQDDISRCADVEQEVRLLNLAIHDRTGRAHARKTREG